MSISINVQPGLNGTLLATSYSFDDAKEPFVTFDVTVPGSGHVAVFLRNTDDARRLVDAAVEAYKKVQAQESTRSIETMTSSIS